MIRQADLWDLFNISFMWEQMMEEVYPEKERNKEKFCLALVGKLYLADYMIFVKEGDRGVVGFIMGFMDYEPYGTTLIAKCEHLYVDEKDRSKSYDKELVDEFMAEAERRDAEKVNFLTIPERTDFWERKGYRIQEVLMEQEV